MTSKKTYRLNINDIRIVKTGISIGYTGGYTGREFIYLGRQPTDKDVEFILKIYRAGKSDSKEEIKRAIGIS